MNLEQHLVLAYLEEDNVQRAYFRVKPLLTMEGNVAEEARQLWPEEGGLRIVPDRGEQHTFKERMRGLGPFCAMDLRGIPADAGKIRTNKNYRPDRGEINQYILYSDTVKPLPEHTFYEILEGSYEDAAARPNAPSHRCFTSVSMIRFSAPSTAPRPESRSQPHPARGCCIP